MEEIKKWKIDNFRLIELGKTGGRLIYLLQSKPETKKRVLIAAGFHGDEVAGVRAIKRFLAGFNPVKTVGVSILPLVNPTGFELGQRFNKWNENPNRGYCHREMGLNKKMPREGKILMKNIKLIKQLSSDGFLSLHEDILSDKFYVYTFEKLKRPGKFSKMLLGAGKKYFESYGDGVIEDNFSRFGDDTVVKKGLSFNKHDGSFEDYLFHLGVEKTACTETPGREKLEKRIEANVSIIKAFINFYQK